MLSSAVMVSSAMSIQFKAGSSTALRQAACSTKALAAGSTKAPAALKQAALKHLQH